MCNNSINKPIFDETIELADNAMLKKRPELFDEWHFEKNNELGLDIYKITQSSAKKPYWICQNIKCQSSFNCSVANKIRGKGCSYCSGRKVNHTNSLATCNPELAKQWHPTLNVNLTPHDVTCRKGMKVWWRCRLNHEWKATIASRSDSRNCPYCSPAPKQVMIGFNDMWTINPVLASMLANPEDGYKYTEQSNKRVNWICPYCNTDVRGKAIGKIRNYGLSCPTCSDGISYPEKLMSNILKNLNIVFYNDKSFEWSNKRRYDFYLPDYNLIIETHGQQHYIDRNRRRGRSLKEEQENDRYKEHIAKENGIENYISIDCRKSEMDFIVNNLINSSLSLILPLNQVDWDIVAEDSSHPISKLVCDLYNSNMSVHQIVKETGYHIQTVQKYLSLGMELGWCQ